MVRVYVSVRNQERVSEQWSARGGSRQFEDSVRHSAHSAGSQNQLSNSVNSNTARSQPQRQGTNSTTTTIRRRRSSSGPSLSRQIAYQSYLYVGALWITWGPVVILRGVQLAQGVTYYWMLIWVALSIPMHGFWNALVYLRPRWIQKRKEQAEKRLIEEGRRELQEGPPEGGGRREKLPSVVVSYLKDFSVAAVDALREGDISDISELGTTDGSAPHHDGDNNNLAQDAQDATISMEEVGITDRSVGTSVVTFASKLVSNVEIDAGADSFADEPDTPQTK